MPDDRISMSEIARRLGVSLPAVSNWRRRYPSFPTGEAGDGQDLFAIQEIASWLGGRKIQTKDLEPWELPGATYGSRFRRSSNLASDSDDTINPELWQDFRRLRRGEDVAQFADLALGLLYLAGSDIRRWNDIMRAESGQLHNWMDRAATDHVPILDDFREAYRLLSDAYGELWTSEVVGLVDRVRRSDRGTEAFEFLLERFADAEGRRGAAMHTPSAVIRLLVELVDLEPGASVFDPCCNSGGFLVGAAMHLAARDAGRPLESSFTGHALSERSMRLARMNLLLRGLPADVDARAGMIFRDGPLMADGRFDVVLSNPPFDVRGYYGSVPSGRTNFAWLQYIASALADNGRAAVVMSGGTLFREGAERQVRANMIDDGSVEGIVALPPGLFASTGIPVTVWLLGRRPQPRQEILLVDATDLGHMISRTQRSLSDQDRKSIVDTVASWRTSVGYRDARGFSASVAVQRIRDDDHVLTPARYVGTKTTVEAPPKPIHELRDDLARLARRASEVDQVAERQLDRIRVWFR